LNEKQELTEIKDGIVLLLLNFNLVTQNLRFNFAECVTLGYIEEKILTNPRMDW
jgi:hypothetical protein